MKRFQVTVNGKQYEVEVEELQGGASSAPIAQPIEQPVAKSQPKKTISTGAEGKEKVVAPMPGKIVDVKVSVGQAVKEGDVLLILEAMKMENEVVAPVAGNVKSINVNKGASVEASDVLVTID